LANGDAPVYILKLVLSPFVPTGVRLLITQVDNVASALESSVDNLEELCLKNELYKYGFALVLSSLNFIAHRLFGIIQSKLEKQDNDFSELFEKNNKNLFDTNVDDDDDDDDDDDNGVTDVSDVVIVE